MKRNNSNFILFICFLLYTLTICISLLGHNSIALLMLIACSVLELFGIKRYIGYYNNVILIFIAFSFLYGLSGPIVALLGKQFLPVFGNYFDFGSWFLSYSLSEIALLLSIIIFYRKDDSNNDNDKIEINENKINYLAKMSNIIMLLGSVFQLINMYRVGGFTTLFMDKAVYQARETELTLTLPVTQFINISIACLSLYIGYCRFKKIKINKSIIIKEIIFSIPYLLQILLLGQRGNLLSMFVIFFIGIYYFKPLKHLKGKVMLIIILLYLLTVFLYTNRGIISLISKDRNLFYNKVSDISRYVDNINPGSNEFSVPFGNYNTVIISGHYNYKYGESYLRGLLLLVPSFLYPGIKPAQITYEFRNNYFASFGEKSSISGTAFSSILEAYWNFGYTGVFIMYFVYGIIIIYIEKTHKKKKEFYKLFYLLFTASIVSFSRTQLGGIINLLLYIYIYIMIIVVFPYQLKNK